MKKGGSVSAMARLNIVIAPYATAVPAIAPPAESTSASVRNCRTTAARDAPSAVRMPTSFVLCAARSRRRFATFAQAMRRTRNTAPSIEYSSWRGCGPICASMNPLTSAVKFAFDSLNSAASCLAIVAKSTVAWSIVTPGLSFPITFSPCPSPRLPASGSICNGSQMLAPSGNEYFSGITPTIVNGWPFARITWPSTLDSPPKRVFHMP